MPQPTSPQKPGVVLPLSGVRAAEFIMIDALPGVTPKEKRVLRLVHAHHELSSLELVRLSQGELRLGSVYECTSCLEEKGLLLTRKVTHPFSATQVMLRVHYDALEAYLKEYPTKPSWLQQRIRRSKTLTAATRRCSQFRWARRLLGGVWQCWFIAPDSNLIWLDAKKGAALMMELFLDGHITDTEEWP